jgi:protein-disulfide isomerase
MTPRQTLLLAAVAGSIAAGGFAAADRPWLAAAGDLLVAPAQAATSEELLKAGPLGEMALGDPNAPNIVIEYASMTCSHCQTFHVNTFDAFKEKYIDTGKVYFIFREYPLDPLATSAIMLARCGPKERFFPIVDLLFDRQPDWAFVSQPAPALLAMVRQAGFTEESFKACLTNQEVLDGVNWVKNRAAAEFSVRATPTFFLNGEMKSGALTLEEIDEILAE